MAQQQKHWIQGMLGEDTYVAFPYFYDISGWSNPLLFNVGAGARAALLSPAAELVAPQSRAGRTGPAGGHPEHRGPAHVELGQRAPVGRVARVSLRARLAHPIHARHGRRHRVRRAAGYDVLIATQGNPGLRTMPSSQPGAERS